MSAFILSFLSTVLREPQTIAKTSYRNKELLKAASLLPANATTASVDAITKEKINPMITDKEGNSFTFSEKNIDYTSYLEEGEKKGYSHLEYKLYYQIKDGGIILPVNGFGLWDAIYGYLGVDKNGFTIIGISWYDQKETPGLGAEIENPSWQDEFKNKNLFHGKKMESFGISFVPKEMMKTLSPEQKEYNIDAISGATITTDGVQNAIKIGLSPYIPLLRKIQRK